MVFTLTDIPGAMRQEGWPIGAAVMERWFAGAARTMSDAEKKGDRPPGDVEARLVTIGWCRNFSRFTMAENKLITTWSTPVRLDRAHPILTRRVREWRRGLRSAGPFRFGDLHAPAATIDRTCQINVEAIDSPWFGGVDDFYAAIGRGAVKIAVSGMAVPLDDGRVRLTIDQVATYLRDTYDFNGDQMLGSWGPAELSRAAILAPAIQVVRESAKGSASGPLSRRYWAVGNDSFRAWRNHYHHGSDFIIYSNVALRRLLRPVVVEVAA